MTEEKHILLDRPTKGKIGKQIRLPFSKAVEISMKSLRVRFWLSMLTVSSIILAIAFLSYVWATSRVQSAIAIGLKDEAVKVLDVGQAVDEAWKPFERELSKRFAKRRGDYKLETEKLFGGNTGRFKKYCAEISKASSNPIDFKGLPFDNATIGRLACQARALGLDPDLDRWVEPSLALAGIKGVVQAEVDRI